MNAAPRMSIASCGNALTSDEASEPPRGPATGSARTHIPGAIDHRRDLITPVEPKPSASCVR